MALVFESSSSAAAAAAVAAAVCLNCLGKSKCKLYAGDKLMSILLFFPTCNGIEISQAQGHLGRGFSLVKSATAFAPLSYCYLL